MTARLDASGWGLEALRVGAAGNGTWTGEAVLKNLTSSPSAGSFTLDVSQGSTTVAVLSGTLSEVPPGRSMVLRLTGDTAWTRGRFDYVLSTGVGF